MSDKRPLTASDREELLRRIRDSWGELEAALGGFDEDGLARPGEDGWSAKDHAAHIAGWLDLLQARIEGTPEHVVFGLDADAYRRAGLDALNESLHQRNARLSPAEALDWLHRSHARTLAAVAALDETALARPIWPDDPKRRPLITTVVGNTYEHYDEHLAAIRALQGGGG
jgi:hypothetical protein